MREAEGAEERENGLQRSPDISDDEIGDVGCLYVPNRVKIHALESPEDLAQFLTQIHIREMTKASLQKLSGILNMLSFPVTLLSEEGYEDTIYRDTFYHYFSGKFASFQRDCVLVAFFQGTLNPELFYQYDLDAERFLQSRFAGVCVLKPIRSGELGRTVLSVRKLALPRCCVQTANYSFSVMGHALRVNGFPYTSQDTETMSCAEVSVWSILDYYGTRFPDFRVILPSEILKELERHIAEQTLPTRGLEFGSISALFKAFGFAPRLYDRKAFSDTPEHQALFHACFHCYVESGIPVVVGLSGERRGEEAKHAIVCIGHGMPKDSLDPNDIRYLGRNPRFPYVDSSALYEKYVVMDDNRPPYQIASFEHMPDWDTSQISTFAVPLRRGVFLEAGDAAAIAETIFQNENLGVAKLLSESGAQAEQHNPFVLRLFLAASSSYREFRAKHSKDVSSAVFYGSIRLPEYIWCAEISTLRQFRENRVLGEIVIDAKTSRNSYLDSLILVRCLDHIGFRTPDEDAIRAIDTGLKRRAPGLTHPFAMYDNNLKWCGGDDDI